jgi:hypothetical protein
LDRAKLKLTSGTVTLREYIARQIAERDRHWELVS